jgi:DNA-binding transcriptional regulator YiaG
MNLRALRKRTGLRISDVAIELDCALSSIRNWKKGELLRKWKYGKYSACEICINAQKKS